MKTAIEVKDRKEAEAVQTAWRDPAVRAFVIIIGTLTALPSDRSRRRVMTFVTDLLQEEQATKDARAIDFEEGAGG